MIKVTDTLSSMVMAAPLTVAASSAISHDTGAQRFEMHHNTRTVLIGTQWRLTDRLKASGTQAPVSAEWYGAHRCNTGRPRGIADLGATPSIRQQDDSRTAWYVEEGGGAHRLIAAYDAGWRRRSDGYGFGDDTGARYITRSGVSVGLLHDGSAAEYRHPDNAMSFVASNMHEATWSWTQTT